VEKDEKTNLRQRLPDYEWDGDIVQPCEARRIAYLIADRLRIGVAYAESRFVNPNVAYDLDKW
jgi:hypothetical protein